MRGRISSFITGFFLAVLFGNPALFGQSVLTLKEAIRLGIENNLEVRIVKSEALLAKESNTYGAAGFLPTVNLTGGRSFQWNDISQRFSSGLEVNRPGVSTNQTNAGLAATWVLFDGGKMFITKQKQDEQEGVGQLRVQNQILSLTDSIAAAYFQLVLAKLDMDITRQDIGRTEERNKLASEQFRIGTRSKSDMLQAQIDLNILRNRLATQKAQLEIRKGGFNQLLGRDPEMDFEVTTEVILGQGENFNQLKDKVIQENLQLKVQQKNLEISKLGIKEIKSRALPQINLNTGYNFGRTNSAAGFALYNQSFGPNIGLSLSMPLFTGISVKKLVTLANIDLETRNLHLKLMESRISLQLWRAIKNLDLHLQSMETETENIRLAKENLAIAKSRFELAQSNTLELKDAEIQLSGAESRLLQARFNAKISEMTIRRLEGKMPVDMNQ